MKRILSFAVLLTLFATTVNAQKKAEDKSKRPSPPARVTQKISSGATIIIDYSQPSIKGRTIGKDLEPMEGKVWRTGANEATVFETDKDVTIDGQKIPAGKNGCDRYPLSQQFRYRHQAGVQGGQPAPGAQGDPLLRGP